MNEEFPIEELFLNKLKKIENECEKFTIDKLNSLGEKAILTYKNLGTMQSLLYRFACCFWGCNTEDHKLEYTVGRVVGHCQASIRLIGFGYYDESLALTRNISEIANLLALFNYDQDSFKEWKSLDEKTAWKKFGPSKVRTRINNSNGIVPIERDHYGRLCSIGSHINPTTTPQGFNPVNIPTVGALFQELGFFVTLNELACSMAVVGGGISKTKVIEKSIKKQLNEVAIKLVEQSGSITTDNMHSVWGELEQMEKRPITKDKEH